MPVINTDTDEGKAELQKLIDAQVEGLKSKNQELLGESKKVKESMKAIQDQLDEIKAAKEAAEEEAAAKSGDVEKIKSALEAKSKKEKDELLSKLELQTGRLNQTLVDKGLTDALVSANIAAHHIPAVTALIKATSKAEIEDVDGVLVAKFDGKPIKDYVSEWAQGDLGKHYIAAPNNGGGGASGSIGGGKAPSGKKADWSVKEKTAYIRENGKEAYDKLQ
jgi:signal recognition particle GTPase